MFALKPHPPDRIAKKIDMALPTFSTNVSHKIKSCWHWGGAIYILPFWRKNKYSIFKLGGRNDKNGVQPFSTPFVYKIPKKFMTDAEYEKKNYMCMAS